jgi:hypothetical protein
MSDLQVRGPLFGGTGTPSPFTADFSGAQRVADGHARYMDAVIRGNVYTCTYVSATVPAASATAVGAFGFYNPPNSGKNAVLWALSVAITTFTAGTTGAGIGFQFVPNQTPTTQTAGVTPSNTLVGSSNKASAAPLTAGTIVGAPTTLQYVSFGVYADLAAGDVATFKDELAGSIIVAPGSGLSICMTGTLVATIIPTLVWEEIPLLP